MFYFKLNLCLVNKRFPEKTRWRRKNIEGWGPQGVDTKLIISSIFSASNLLGSNFPNLDFVWVLFEEGVSPSEVTFPPDSFSLPYPDLLAPMAPMATKSGVCCRRYIITPLDIDNPSLRIHPHKLLTLEIIIDCFDQIKIKIKGLWTNTKPMYNNKP